MALSFLCFCFCSDVPALIIIIPSILATLLIHDHGLDKPAKARRRRQIFGLLPSDCRIFQQILCKSLHRQIEWVALLYNYYFCCTYDVG